jgi:hypothetical protein
MSHAVLVGWSAAGEQRRGHVWLSARELALDRQRWEVEMHDERGSRTVLPDLAVWLTHAGPPIALVVDDGRRRTGRQRAILEGWHDAVQMGRYGGVRVDCIGELAAERMTKIGTATGLDHSVFLAVAQSPPEEISAILPASDERHAAPGDPLRALVALGYRQVPGQQRRELPQLPHPEPADQTSETPHPELAHPTRESPHPEATDRAREPNLVGEDESSEEPPRRIRWRPWRT